MSMRTNVHTVTVGPGLDNVFDAQESVSGIYPSVSWPVLLQLNITP